LRAKGRGVAVANGDPGDLYAEIEIVIPKHLSERSQELIKELELQFAAEQPPDPRRDLKW
jgi:DnaJ-class molecular chaperone